MLRKIILASIMAAAALTIIFALNRQGGRHETASGPAGTLTPIPGDQGDVGQHFEVKKVDPKTGEPVVRIRGEKAVTHENGPVEITKPDILITSDPRRTIQITADSGTLSGQDTQRLDDVVLTGNVLLKVIPPEGDTTEITCKELRFYDRDQRLRIPGDVVVAHPAFRIEGRNVEGFGTVGRLVLKENVHVTIAGGVGPLWDRMEGREAAPAEPVPLVITCAGDLEFEDDKNQATFNQDVRAVQGTSSALGDKMVVLFERMKKVDKNAAKPLTDEQSTRIRKVILQGNDVDRVQLTGPGRKAWGEELAFDTEAGLARLTGRGARLIEQTGEDSVTITGGEMQFGDGIKVPEGIIVPAVMQASTGRILVQGAPAQLSLLRQGATAPEILSGRIILMDQKSSAVLVASPGEQVHVTQPGLDLYGKSVTLFQKTAERAESISVEGPGKVIYARDSAGTPSGKSAEPVVITFSQAMSYQVSVSKAVFEGDVSVEDGASKVKSDRLEATTTPGTGKGPGITDMVASGNVTATDGTQKVVAGQLSSRRGNVREMVVTSSAADAPAEIAWGKSLLRAQRIVYTETPGSTPGSAASTRIVGTGGGYLNVVSDSAPAAGQPVNNATQVWFGDQVVFQDGGDLKYPRADFSGKVRSEQGAMRVNSDNMTVNFNRASGTAPSAGAFNSLQVREVVCNGDVQLTQLTPDAPEADQPKAFCDVMLWDVTAQEVKLLAQPGKPGGRERARVIQGGNSLEAPVVRAVVTNAGFQRSTTEGGGTLVSYSRSNALNPDSEPRPLTVTWKGQGLVEPKPSDQPGQPDWMVATFSGDAVARTQTDQLLGDTLEVYMRRGAAGQGGTEKTGTSKLDVQRVVAIGHVKADLYDTREADYRYARGGKLTWDRVDGRIVLAGPEAVAWSRTGEWRGDEVLITQRSDGSLFIHSSGTEMIFIADEKQATVKQAPPDLGQWEPLD